MQGRARQLSRLEWHEDPSAIEEQYAVYAEVRRVSQGAIARRAAPPRFCLHLYGGWGGRHLPQSAIALRIASKMPGSVMAWPARSTISSLASGQRAANA